jgi:epoxide hydrolase-like predicted phosphatase
VDAVIFDLGGVVFTNGSPYDLARRFPHHDPDVVVAAVMGDYGGDSDHPWHRVERGEVPLADAMAHVAAALAGLGIVLEPPSGGMRFVLNDAMVGLVHELREAGLRLGVLTNNVKEFRPRWWPLLPFEELFDTIVDSSEVGMRKPNPAIYELVLDRLGVPAARAAFLDDLVPNVAAAAAVGLHAIHVVGDGAAAIEQVRRLTGVDANPG